MSPHAPTPPAGPARPKPVAHLVGYAPSRAGAGIAVCHNRLFDRRFAGAIDAIRAGRIGRVFAVRLEAMTGGWWAGADGDDPSWRTRAAVARGGCLLDNGYHSIYLAEALAGSPIIEVYARTTIAAHASDVDDTAFVLATHASGATTSGPSGEGRRAAGREAPVRATGRRPDGQRAVPQRTARQRTARQRAGRRRAGRRRAGRRRAGRRRAGRLR